MELRNTPMEGNKFWLYSQNNSGGSFQIDDVLDHMVFVEAATYQEANERAEEIDIYFHGVGDCPCCGNRWSELGSWDSDDGMDSLEICGWCVSEYHDHWSSTFAVYYKDNDYGKTTKCTYSSFRGSIEDSAAGTITS